jgi:hypothetical protein
MFAIVASHRGGMLGSIDMRTSINILRMLMRVLGAILIVLGLLFWSGNALALIPVHMLAGLLLVLSLWTMAILAARGGEQPGLVTLAFAWGLVVPILGVTQDSLLHGPAHVLIQVVHLLLGLGAIGLTEVLARRCLPRLTGVRPGGVAQRTVASN